MNYRHAYHAGNFADVLKQKPAPFRVIDTHAGIGLYDLSSPEAQKTGEWHDGIGRLLGPDAAPLPDDAAARLAPYLAVVSALNPGGTLQRYPGSPLLARRLMRQGDTLIANELHPDDAITLRRTMAGEPDTKVMALDGWTALKSLLPPRERRGLTLVDPPYEESGDLDRLVAAAAAAHRRFATGTLLLWYPIKDPRPVVRMHADVADLGVPRALIVEIHLQGFDDVTRLNGCGLLVLNQPYTLSDSLAVLMPLLADRLSRGPGAGYRLDELS